LELEVDAENVVESEMRHAKEDIEDTDIESDNVGTFRTPVALQKIKPARVIKSSALESDSEGKHSEPEIDQKMKMNEKKKNKRQPDNATQVRQDQMIDCLLLTALQI
jgi:type IV secretory pathway VirB10-like protein